MVPAGDADHRAIIERAKMTCAKMGFVPRNVYVCNDLGSAYLNVITMDGISFGTENTELLPESNYRTIPTGVYTDYIMCSPYYSSDPSVIRFRNFVKESTKKLSHRPIKEAGQ